MKCRNCAKIFCEHRDTEYNCENGITFVQAGIYDQPMYLDYNSNNFEESCRKLVLTMKEFGISVDKWLEDNLK
jgi:hypothetical protein